MSRTDCRRGYAPAPFEELTRCEAAALALAASGIGNADIGAWLGIDARTVGLHLRAARVATGTANERELLAWYWRRLVHATAERVHLEAAS